MATIITINSADLMETLTRNNLNTNFANLNAELATMLPKSGGTMTGNIAMGSNRITALPAPIANDEAARKLDTVPAAGSIVTSMIADLNVTTVKIGDDQVTPAKMPHDNNVRRLMIPGMITTGTQNMNFGNAAVASGQGLPMVRAGCITGMSVIDATLNVVSDSQPYVTSGAAADGRFAAGDRIYINRNTSTGVTVAKINGTTVTNLSQASSATDDLVVMLEVEFDD